MTAPRSPHDPSTDYTVAFSPRQVGGFVLIAAILIALGRRLRRSPGKG